MPKELEVKIEFSKKIKNDVYLIGFKSAYIASSARCGQFLHLKVDDKITILRRPLSIHKIEKNLIYLLFRVRGRGTKLLSQCKKGDVFDAIGPLGNGFHVPRPTPNAQRILVAGGMGVAPLVFLAEKLREIRSPKSETRNLILLGAKSKKEVLAESEFKKLGFEVHIATDDGSRGFKGSVVELLKEQLRTYNLELRTNIYACGPKEMFYEIKKVLEKYPQIQAQVSFEQFMGCGLGICYGCAIETKEGYKKVCKDGPVFDLKII
ncbi:MAG: dihydroorotate dehydrogenase electron transfer subunit [Candidatus Omnitrophica bacterium]|jgi:dihydroorotate dehydrogenase electron transfer subunit|nr:dihydroorotate dehydrogenase electron transfer subunit [Candidatus Omnitrophota bacterium]